MTTITTARLDVAALKRQRSLAAVVQASGVTLRPAGPQRLVGCCPFHADTRPSFLVDEHDGHFHCFACHAHGDVLDFLMRRESLDFRQALERLGGTPPVGRSPASSGVATRERRWDRLTLEEQVLMNTAAAIYQDTLWHAPQALAYLRQRGLPDWLIRAAGLGYADGHSLEVWLRRHSGVRLAHDLGLLGLRRQERLAGRVVVPELRGGHCIWLIGRTLADAPDRPKYVALPGERPLLGQERAAGHRQVFFVEGVFDFLVALAWKLPACSPCGTSLPAERLGCLARAQVIYGVFDADQEGRAAAARFGDLLGARWRSIDLPDGSDLADLASRPQGRGTFFQLLAACRRAQREGVSDVAG